VRGSENKNKKEDGKEKKEGVSTTHYFFKSCKAVYNLVVGNKTHPFLRRKPGGKYYEPESYSFSEKDQSCKKAVQSAPEGLLLT
jgi:hypothetical protein